MKKNPNFAEIANLNGKGVAQQVSKATNRSEHGALDQSQRLSVRVTVFTQILLRLTQNPILSHFLLVIERNPKPNHGSR